MAAPQDSRAQAVKITAALQRRLRKEIITDALVNREVEGQIEGPEDSVKILVANAANVSDYTGGFITPQENVDADDPTLTIDHKKTFSFSLSGNTNLTRYVEGFSNETFSEILEQAEGYVLSKADPALTGEMTAGDLTYAPATDDIGSLLSQANGNLSETGTPRQGRFVVLPASSAQDAYDVVAERDTVRGDQADRMGFIGMFRGLEVYEAPTGLFPTPSANSNPVAHYGHRGYHFYADAVVSVQVLNEVPNLPAGTLVQGLHCAGSKVSQPKAFGRIEIT